MSEDKFPKANIDDYVACFEDHKRLVKKIDIIINGVDGAAEQASLCDIVGDIEDMKEEIESFDDLFVRQSKLIARYQRRRKAQRPQIDTKQFLDAIEKSIRNYNLSYLMTDEDNHLPLIDLLSNPSQTVEKGMEEVRLIVDHIYLDLNDSGILPTIKGK